MTYRLIEMIPVLTVGAYSANDMLFVPTEVPNAIPFGKSAILRSIVVIDKDDQELPFDLMVFDSQATTAALNAAEATDDANLAKLLAVVSIVTADYIDFASGQFGQVYASAGDIGMGTVLKLADLTLSSLWIAGVTRDTPTHTASGLVFKIGLEIF